MLNRIAMVVYMRYMKASITKKIVDIIPNLIDLKFNLKLYLCGNIIHLEIVDWNFKIGY